MTDKADSNNSTGRTYWTNLQFALFVAGLVGVFILSVVAILSAHHSLGVG